MSGPEPAAERRTGVDRRRATGLPRHGEDERRRQVEAPPAAAHEPGSLILDPNAPASLVGAVGDTVSGALHETGKGFRSLLSISEFRLVWFSQIASQLADKFLVYSLLTVTYQRSGANTQEAVVLLAYTFPSVILSPIAGIFADRFDKRRLMTVTNLVRGGLILLVPASSLLPYFSHVTWHLLLITLLFSAVGQFFAPAEASAMPFVVPRRLLITATSVFTLTIVATLVFGLPVSSILVRLFGPSSPYYVAAALFGLAALANAAMRTRLAPAETPDDETPAAGRLARIYDEVTETLAFLRGRRDVLQAFGQLGLAVMLIFTIFTLSQGYMKTVLHLDPRDSYLILVPAAIGMGLTAGYLGQGHQGDRARMLLAGLLGLGTLLLLMGLIPYLLAHQAGLVIPFAAIIGALFGGAFGLVFIPAVTLLQESTDEDQRGRIFGAMFTVLNLAIAIPLFLAGLAADTFGLNFVVIFMGAILVFYALVPVIVRRIREDRVGRRGPPPGLPVQS
ncbi:MAG TPA: MFS transporter [Candidatus Dormibacteraeota bacterium]|jgi:predicted MFS family arabinose efflux permease|nr:MFS transporter [Candidatus Dormibacteraeota bacterium]